MKYLGPGSHAPSSSESVHIPAAIWSGSCSRLLSPMPQLGWGSYCTGGKFWGKLVWGNMLTGIMGPHVPNPVLNTGLVAPPVMPKPPLKPEAPPESTVM